MKDFFITYSKDDQEWAEWIAWQLELAKYTVVLQAWDFLPGNNFVLEMQRAASETNKTIAVLSESFLNSIYTQPEWASAFSKDPDGSSSALIPIRVKPCKLEGLLRQIVYIDLLDREESQARIELLSGVTGRRIKPESPPGFPRERKDKRIDKTAYPGLELAPPRVIKDRHEGRDFLTYKFGKFVVSTIEEEKGAFLFMFDIDGMTSINKKYGSDLGNNVISKVLEILVKESKANYIGRCGDDTFYAVLIGTSEEHARVWGNEFLRKVRNSNWRSLAKNLFVTCSAGFVYFDSSDDDQDAIFRAVQGYRYAKHDGRDKLIEGPLFSFIDFKLKEKNIWQNEVT